MICFDEYSTLAANHLLKSLEGTGCQAAYP